MSKHAFTLTIACTGVLFGVIGLARFFIQTSRAAPAPAQASAGDPVARGR